MMAGRRFAHATMMTASVGGLTIATAPAIAQVREFNIPPQPLSSALIEYSLQADVLIVVPPELLAGKRSIAVNGIMPVNVAISLLLRKSSLRAIPNPNGGYRVGSSKRTDARRSAARAHLAPPSLREGKKTEASGTWATGGEPATDIVVTAQRRDETLSKVPISIAAYSDRDLKKAGIADMADLSHATPGFNVQPGASIGGGNNVSIRGVSTTQGAATIGIYIDDVPASVRANTWTNPVDPSTFDLQRVEVLRGPQGTLYGSGSEGGTLRYITAQPSLTKWSGQADGEINGNVNGGIGYEAGAAIGGPIVGDVLGFRISADNRHDGGFINDVSRTNPNQILRKNINGTDNTSVRAALTWAPAEGVLITPSFNYQRLHGNDVGLLWSGSLFPTNHRYQSFEVTPTPYTDNVKIGSLRASYDFGPATLTSITSGLWRDLKRTDDYSSAAIYSFEGAAGSRAFLASNPGYQSPQYSDSKQTQYTQEVRLTTNDQHAPIYFTIGGFYSYAKQSLSQDQYADANAGYPASVFLLHAGQINPNVDFGPDVSNGPFPNGGILAEKYQQEIDRQIAGFADATWNISSNLRLNAGVRVARLGYSFQYVANGFSQGGLQNLPKTTTHFTQVDPKINLSWQTTPDLLFYATAAKGARAGGSNRPIPAARCGVDLALTGAVPQSYGQDSVWSFEGGTKAKLLNGLLAVSGSAFYLKWHNVQQTLLLSNCAVSYVGNFGDATSKGFDLSVQVHPTRWLTLTANSGYTKSTLDQSVTGTASATTGAAPILATKGSPLSYVPDWTADFAGEINYPLNWRNLNAFVRADYQYNGTYYRTAAPGSALYNPLSYRGEPYHTVNLRAGVSKEAWVFTVFAKNLGSSYPILFNQQISGANGLTGFESTLAPRTFGASINYRW